MRLVPQEYLSAEGAVPLTMRIQSAHSAINSIRLDSTSQASTERQSLETRSANAAAQIKDITAIVVQFCAGTFAFD